MVKVGFAGTAKNTGKTTAMTAVALEAAKSGLRLGLTSIGMDGEQRDNVTGLPKPRVLAPQGALVATARPFEAADEASATLELLEITAFRSPLGAVALYRVLHPGLVLLAGPLVAAELREVLALMDQAGAELALVDGAINRLAPMTAMDRLVLSTGAARHSSTGLVLEEAESLSFLFSLEAPPAGEEPGTDRVVAAPPGGRPAITLRRLARRALQPTLNLDGPTVLTDAETAGELIATLRRLHWRTPFRLVFPSLVATPALKALVTYLETIVPGEVVFPSGPTLAVAGPAAETAKALLTLKKAGWGVHVSSPVRLTAFTSSPYRPLFNPRGRYYEASLMPEDAYADFQRDLRHRTGRPVFDVVASGPHDLFRLLTLP